MTSIKMSLFDICSNELVNDNVNLSSLSHLKMGKEISLKRFNKNSKKI